MIRNGISESKRKFCDDFLSILLCVWVGVGVFMWVGVGVFMWVGVGDFMWVCIFAAYNGFNMKCLYII